MCAIVLMPKGHHREIAQRHWGLTDEQMKGKHVHHRIPRSKGGTNAPENLYVCSPSFHANIWHDGRYKIIGNASEVARLGGLARQRAGFTPEGLEKRRKASSKIGKENKEKKIGLFGRSKEKRRADSSKAGKLGIKSTLAKNPNHMREMGLKGGAPGIQVECNGLIYKSISKAVSATGVSRTRAFRFLNSDGVYIENQIILKLL